jgi:hypothetical protein
MGLRLDTFPGPFLVDDTTGKAIGYRDEKGVDRYLDGRLMPETEDGSGSPVQGGSSGNKNINTFGAYRKFGHQAQGESLAFGGAHGIAYQIKCQAERPFKSVRVAIHNRNASYPSGPWIVSAAATENPNFDTDAQFCQPIVNGVTYTALATNDATRYGYRVATFGGVQESQKIVPGSISPEYLEVLNIPKPNATGTLAFNMVGTIISDPIDVESVPATDGGLPWLLLRLQMLDTGQNAYGGGYGGAFNQYAFYNAQTNTDESIDLRSQEWFRDFQGGFVNPSAGQNFVTNPALTFTKPANLNNWAAPNISLIFDYGIPVRSVLVVGDSTTEVHPWAEIAFSQLSTPEKPITFVNCGQSSNASWNFNQMLNTYAEIGAPITDVVLPCFSVNDYNPGSSLTDYEAQRVIFRLLERISYANSLGAKVWLWTSFNLRFGYGSFGRASQINQINNYFRAYAANNPDTCGMFDVEAVWVDGVGPDKYSKDGVHQNNLGTLAQAEVVIGAWK